METVSEEYTVSEEECGLRLDVFLARKQEVLKRNFIQKLIKDEKVKIDGKASKPSKKVKTGERVSVVFEPPHAIKAEAQNIELDILYEDSDIIVVNKQKGLVVHPAPGSPDGTLVNALLYHTKDLSGINGELRPGIVHRIDKDTTGVLVVAKNDLAHQGLAEQFEVHSIDREYVALVTGDLKEDSGVIDMPIGRDPNNRIKRKVTYSNSKDAVTHFKVLKRYGEYTLVKFKLETGRTHQIRVHMKELGHPLVGDPLYGKIDKNFPVEGQLLHARKLGFIHPTKKEYIEFESPLPEEFTKVLDKLESGLEN